MSSKHFVRGAQLFMLSGLLMFALSADALGKAKGNSVRVKGPSSVKIGTNFTFKVSGTHKGKANFLAVWEASPSFGCAKTYDVEYHHASYLGGKDLGQPKTFLVKMHLTASNPGMHFMCAYLINKKSTKTYAHAGAHWVDHA